MNALAPLDTRTRASLVAHGLVVVLLGLLAGFPYASAIDAGAEDAIRQWRMAHLEGVLNGLVLLAVGAAGGLLLVSARAARWLSAALLVAGYGNVVAACIAAAAGVRGLAPEGPAANLVVFTLFTAAIAGIFAAIGIGIAGAWRRAARSAGPEASEPPDDWDS